MRTLCLFLFLAGFQSGSLLAAPGAFALTSATPVCNGNNPQISLSWTTSSGVLTYDLYRDGSLHVMDLPANGRSFPDTGAKVTGGTTYTYFLRAKNSDGTTDSGALQATTLANCGGAPFPPQSFTLTSVTASCNSSSPQIVLNWTTSVGATAYDIYRNGVLFSPGVPPGGRTYVDTGQSVIPGQTYNYFVRARNADGTNDSGSLQATTPGNCGAAPGPGAFSLTGAAAGCRDGRAQVTLDWTASAAATTYDVYRDGSVFLSRVPANTPRFVDYGPNVTMAVTYTYFIRAENASGTRDTGPIQATTAATCPGTSSPVPYLLTDRGSVSLTSPGGTGAIGVGWGQIQPNAGNSTPSGLAIFGLRQGNILVSEAAVPASPPILSGRIYAEIDGAVNTGVAIANPSNQPATVSFFFTDQSGNFGSNSTIIPANGQLAKFLDQGPYNGRSSFTGTFTFSSSVPVSVLALRGLSNERGEFLITTLPVSDLSVPVSQTPLQFPHYADGGGWTTQVVLVNPTDVVLTGAVQFRDPSGIDGIVTVNGQTGSSMAYAIPPRSSQKLQTSGASMSVLSGSVRVVPSGASVAPSGVAVFSFKSAGVTVAEAGVSAEPSATAFRVYAEATTESFQGGWIQTGLALANASSGQAIVTLELNNLDGSPTGLTGTITVPANGQTATFLSQIQGFDTLQLPFRGVLRVSSPTPISVLGLRGRYNERNDFLVTTTMPINEAAAVSTAPVLFPHFADAGGYTTQFILFSGRAGQSSSGSLQLFSNSGQSLNLPLY